jgi:hypothetical protein
MGRIIMVTVTCKQVMGNFTRYRLSNGWFMDKDRNMHQRYHRDDVYSLWEPGASVSGCAAYRGGGKTKKNVLLIAEKGE